MEPPSSFRSPPAGPAIGRTRWRRAGTHERRRLRKDADRSPSIQLRLCSWVPGSRLRLRLRRARMTGFLNRSAVSVSDVDCLQGRNRRDVDLALGLPEVIIGLHLKPEV